MHGSQASWAAAIRRVAAALAAGAIATACGVSSGQQSSGGNADTTPIKVGVVTGLTGPYANLGQAQQNGVNLAIKQLGGKAGNHPISVIVRDDTVNATKAETQARDLIQAQGVQVLTGCVSAATTLVINQVAKQAGVPYIGTCQTEKVNRPPDLGPYTFHIAPATSYDIKATAQWSAQTLGKKGVFLEPDYAWGHEQWEAYSKNFAAAGGQAQGPIWAPLGNTEWSSYIPKIQASNADFVMVGVGGRDAESFLKQAKQFGLDRQMKIFTYLADFAFDQEMGFDPLQGTYALQNFVWTDSNAAVQKFVKDYQAQYKTPPGSYSAYTYNAVMMYADAVKANQYKPDQLVQHLSGETLDLAGGKVTIRKCDRQAILPVWATLGLSQSEAASKGGSAQFGYRQVVKTFPASEGNLPTCAAEGLSS
jgi:branched-chain amino acid transport system substrate-binding protein